MTLEELIVIGGLLHLPVLVAVLAIPRALDWRSGLAVLDPFLRRLFWVYGVFIALTVAAMTAVSLALPARLAQDDVLARAVLAFIAGFWWLRIVVQIAVFDARPLLDRWWRRLGYHGLSALFAAIAAIYTVAVLWEVLS